jgi:hypothetical protein
VCFDVQFGVWVDVFRVVLFYPLKSDSNEVDGDSDWVGVRQRGEGEGDAEGDESGGRRRG